MKQIQTNNVRKCPTLNDYFESYIADRKDLRPTTVIAYREAFKRAGELANLPIDQIKFSDLKHHYAYLRYDREYSASSIDLLNSILVPVFKTAVRDGVIPISPADGCYRSIAKGDAWKAVHKPALDVRTQKAFLEYVHTSSVFKPWENFFIFLFGTGLRIGEAIAVRWEDISFKNRTISIKRSITYKGGQYFEQGPKSAAGYRTIPMLNEVFDALIREYQLSKLAKVQRNGDRPGVSGVIFLNSHGQIHYPSTVNNAINRIVHAYNKEHLYEPIMHFSVHQIRHTFATRLCEHDVNIKVIQSVMGHADFQTTMDIYAEVGEEKKIREFENLNGKIF